MKRTLSVLSLALVWSGNASAASLLLDFGATAVADPYLSLSPGHVVGGVSGTSWNTINTSDDRGDLVYENGTSATGVLLDMGQEDFGGGTGMVLYANAVGNVALVGTGGGIAGQQSLVGDPGSIYGSGNVAANTAPGRDGFFSGSTGSNAAIGLRIDGLPAGEYAIYVMARNTNSNGTAFGSMNIFAAAGAFSTSFDFNALTPTLESNATYSSANPTAYNQFINGENYVSVNVMLGAGQSLFVASDSAGAEPRGFLNSVEIVSVPEPSTFGLLAGAVIFSMGLRRKRHGTAS